MECGLSEIEDIERLDLERHELGWHGQGIVGIERGKFSLRHDVGIEHDIKSRIWAGADC